MNAIHLEPHPMAQRYVKSMNPQITAKFGIVRVEDWDDRISGDVWTTLREQGNGNVEKYVALVNSTDRSALHPDGIFAVVRCHTQSTGEVVLLHDDWLKGAEVIA